MPYKKTPNSVRQVLCSMSLLVGAAGTLSADPCGMVPPIYTGEGNPITRIGEQQTYVFYRDGIETVVIRPGFSGKVDEFGMLIPFPTPPAIRKMPDHIFPHIAAAIDPPEVVVRVNDLQFLARSGAVPTSAVADNLEFSRHTVRVIREEAVGMYEVAVLEAGSPAALKRWMDDHGFRYPAGMDDVCEDYVKERWCFVAIKTKVGSKRAADPRPGQREVRPDMPPNSTFDGHVQAMGFRFRSDELVVPMRLSAFNAGELRNIVYLLTDGPRRIRQIPEEYVVRQISGSQLIKNVTSPLPLRIIGGMETDMEPWQRENLPQQRDPHAKNGAAKEMFAADLHAVRSGQMSLAHEEAEKELLRIGERLGLRGSEIDSLNDESLRKERKQTVARSLKDLRRMTLTVVDGDFPRDVLAKQNLTFAEYRMPASKNLPSLYDANQRGPVPKREGIRVGSWSPVGAGASVPGIPVVLAMTTLLAFGAIFSIWICQKSAVSIKSILLLTILTAALATPSATHADPCGMVPPIYQGGGVPVTRVGEQQTYVFYKDGMESFVIRPGFSGKVDEFGMLIPFPTPPAIRKVPDHIFEHIAAAIDPPEVVIDLRPRRFALGAVKESEEPASRDLSFLAKDEVRVLREEAVGMYEVAVLEAGSSAALKRWMDDHGYRYPDGMDKACEDYVHDGWCFVAVKTKVGRKPGVEPRPGQRKVEPELPPGASFDGFVQAMGFRFATENFVVPMRLSAFNEGKLRNIAYILADGPRRIRKIPEEYVVRQISGGKLAENVTELLPLRIVGGGLDDISPQRLRSIEKQRDPHSKNGAAKELFASDLLAASTRQLALPQEEQEKELLRIGERLGLRGADIDRINAAELANLNKKTVEKALMDIDEMTLTVVDGDFPRDVIAADNLTFVEYVMPKNKNSASSYDVKLRGPAPKGEGVLKIGQLTPTDLHGYSVSWPFKLGAISLLPLAFILVRRRRRLTTPAVLALAALVTSLTSPSSADTDTQSRIDNATRDLTDAKTADVAVAVLIDEANKNQAARERVVKALFDVAAASPQVAQRGWAITALSEIGGYDVDEQLLKIHADESQSMLVRTWAAAGRVAMTRSAEALIEKAHLIQSFPALGRPIGMRLVEKLNGEGDVSVEKLLSTTIKVPQIQQALAPAILARGADALVTVMTRAADQNVRRQATAYLGTLAVQGDRDVPKAVVQAYYFDPEAEDVSWKGGPLFVPGIDWQKDDARALAGNLIAWHVWCDRHGRDAEKRQIHNNLRSIALARAAGYERPRFQYSDTVAWLTTWGKTLGKDAVNELLEIQKVADVPKYADVMNQL